MVTASWTASLDWNTPAGRVLQKLAARLSVRQPLEIIVFGPAPLQIMVGLGEEQIDLPLQIASELNFRTSPRWRSRSQNVTVGNCQLIFPHRQELRDAARASDHPF